MPIGENLPKGGSKEWGDAAEKAEQDFKDYHTKRPFNIGPKSLGLGFGKRKAPLSTLQSKTLSDRALRLRSGQMARQRKGQ
jgi:hypothetical protein